MWRESRRADDVLVINAHRLAVAVTESGMTEVEICSRAGVAHQTFAKMLKGQMVRFPCIGRICKVLEVCPAEIIREVADEALQARGESVLVPEAGRDAHQPKNDSQGPRVTALRRVPS